MNEYLKREDVRRAVLHNEGDAVIAAIDELQPVDAVPWEFLERYAYWFCAPVSFPQFIQDAKAFYRSTVAAMDGFTISVGERKEPHDA